MFCKYCGKELDNDARFCPSCGSSVDKVEEPEKVDSIDDSATIKNSKDIDAGEERTQTCAVQTPTSTAPRKLHVLGLIGFILSCVSFLISFADLGVVSVAGFIISLIGLIQFNKHPKVYKLKGFAIAGVSIGAVGVFIFFLLVFATCALTCAILSTPELLYPELIYPETML